jgi:hypothetical protein
MTAERWEVADRPAELCRLLTRAVPSVARTKAGRRKLRLAGCGCCRALWPLFGKGRNRAAVEMAERYADGQVSKPEALAAGRSAWWGAWVWSRADRRVARAAQAVLMPTIWTAARAGEFLLAPALDARRGCSAEVARRHFAEVFHDLFGNPFRPPRLDPAWRTRLAVDLARGICDDRAPDRLPILADALEEAGCDDAQLLDHCRGDAPHVCGCWVVDWVLFSKPAAR